MHPKHREHLALKARIEQLAAAMADGDPATEEEARTILARVAVRGSCGVLTQVFFGLVRQWDADQADWERLGQFPAL
jgi:hypothetical protein